MRGPIRRCPACGREQVQAIYGMGNRGRGTGAPRRRRTTWIHKATSRHACDPADRAAPPAAAEGEG